MNNIYAAANKSVACQLIYDDYHGEENIADRFDGRLVPLPGFHHGIESAVNLEHFGQIGEEEIDQVAEAVVQQRAVEHSLEHLQIAHVAPFRVEQF